MERLDRRATGVTLGLLAFVLYLALGEPQAMRDSHYPFAQAFLAGRIWVAPDYPWLELVPRPEGGWYTPFPPLISIVMLPFAAAGVVIDTDPVAAAFGALSVTLMWVLLGRWGVEIRAKLALTIAWAVGSELLWVAATGGQHLAPQAAAACLLTAALVLGSGRRAPALAGFLVGAAILARVPVGLALPLVLWLYRDRAPDGGLPWRAWGLAIAGFAIPVLLLAWYNAARFGSPFELGYGLIANVDGESVLTEPWYDHGIVALDYLPQGLHSMLLRGFEPLAVAPWFASSVMGVSILLTMPVLWWIAGARGTLALVAFLTAWLVMLPDLMHGNPGSAQAGYRFIVDALPILWLLLGIAFRTGIPRPAWVALGAGLVVNPLIFSVAWLGIYP